MFRYARCKTLASAWTLVEYLEANLAETKFMVQLPSQTEFEVWSAHGCSLPPEWKQKVKDLVAKYRAEKLTTAGAQQAATA